ncbi:unnamed protein product [Dovyalis caffra]|uniref:Uncharacterized protein n=1 Tax=Dovyalis caffra TaxID=77055 RepID=A0AAV1QS29_9ROSI|nr:unnamed protein product [Dovyalis caffra]
MAKARGSIRSTNPPAPPPSDAMSSYPKPAQLSRPPSTTPATAAALSILELARSDPPPAAAPKHPMVTRAKTGHLKPRTFSTVVPPAAPSSYSQVSSDP